MKPDPTIEYAPEDDAHLRFLASLREKAAREKPPAKSTTPTYKVWENMKQRVTNPNNRLYPTHGGRGIGMDPRWMRFNAFLADMGPRPDDPEGWGMHQPYWSLARHDEDADYTPENCFWISRDQLTERQRAKGRAERRERLAQEYARL